MRHMELVLEEFALYDSSFDPQTGTIVRAVEVLEPDDNGDDVPHDVMMALRKRFKNRSDEVPSPSPELIDVGITNKCGFGCTYCYQDSTPKAKHAPKELVPTLLKGLDTVPYQIAIGGGEPTIHPDFIWILEQARELGTVPNYTTAGHAMTSKVIEATNRLCGGVAMTYHAFKGLDWFTKHYSVLAKKLKCQVNVHLIADKDVVTNLRNLMDLQYKVGPINLVLLAYYPDVGRANLSTMMARSTYSRELPLALTNALASGMKIAFSEGLLPYFLSRPEIGIDTRFATRSEGIFSCYVGPDGRMTHSSFEKVPEDDRSTIWEVPAQKLWENLYGSWKNKPRGTQCYDCQHRSRCSTPHDFHQFTCAFASHNRLPLLQPIPKGPSRYKVLMEDDNA